MNDQINKLKEQAKEKVISHGAYGETEIYWEINVDKFAELIVQECVRYFNEDYQRDFDIRWREDLSKGIKNHFGVEE